MELKPFYRF